MRAVCSLLALAIVLAPSIAIADEDPPTPAEPPPVEETPVGPLTPTLEPPTVAPAGETTRPLPPMFWAAAGLGTVAAIAFGAFAVSGIVRRDNLDDCKPNCDVTRIDRAKSSFVIADVSLVIAAALSGGLATWFAITP